MENMLLLIEDLLSFSIIKGVYSINDINLIFIVLNNGKREASLSQRVEIHP
jgi:hypothetical protein